MKRKGLLRSFVIAFVIGIVYETRPPEARPYHKLHLCISIALQGTHCKLLGRELFVYLTSEKSYKQSILGGASDRHALNEESDRH
jgi:hypothetical protein